MRWWSFVVLLVCLAGCGKGIETPSPGRGPFEVYFQAFETYSKAQGRDTFGDASIGISFGTLDEQEAGRCEWNFFRGRYVIIDEVKWERLSEGAREALILHELGHCLLQRSHVEGFAENMGEGDSRMGAIPRSLMNPSSVSGEIFEDFKSYYLDELFGKL